MTQRAKNYETYHTLLEAAAKATDAAEAYRKRHGLLPLSLKAINPTHDPDWMQSDDWDSSDC